MLARANKRPIARLVQRRLPHCLDPFDLYVALSSGPDTALFEGMNGPTLLLANAAVRMECRSDQVTVRALSPNGKSLVAGLSSALADKVVAVDDLTLTVRFPPSSSLDPEQRLLAPSPLSAIRAILQSALPVCGEPFATTALGIVAFDYAGMSENLPDNAEDPVGFPDYVFWIPETLLLFEDGMPPQILCAAFEDPDPGRTTHNYNDAVVRLGRIFEVCECANASNFASAIVPEEVLCETDLDDAAYMGVVQRLKEEIAAGEVYQIVPSRTFSTACTDPLRAYAMMRRIEPNSYRFFVRGEHFTLLGASPETSVRVFREKGWHNVEVRPIAGTRPRGASPDQDDRLETELRLDGKELAEHMMLVDLARNDVARISIPGTRRVAKLLTVERYARVMHLVSSVTGRLGIGFDALDALSACLNVGTLTGAPKLRAMQLLREVEQTRRGPYGGAIGWINGAGLMDTAVVIRSALVLNGIAYVRAGAGVVHDSDPKAEADETRRKASALLSVLTSSSASAQP
jgi:anthranilate synthase component I